MNIAEGVLQLKQDFDAVYEAGKSAGGNAGNEYVYTPHLTRFGVDDLNIFNKATVELNIPKVTSYYYMLKQNEANTTVEHIIINGLQDGTITEVESAFEALGERKLKHITLNCGLGMCKNYKRTFYQLRALEVIDGTPLDFSAATGGSYGYLDYAFSYCDALKELRVVPLSIKQPIYFSYSPNLSNESIQSIIDGLADLTGSTSKKLTLHSSLIAKLTEEQQMQIMNKNWTVG